MLWRPNSLFKQKQSSVFFPVPACDPKTENPSLQKPCPYSLASEIVSWPHVIALASSYRWFLSSQLERRLHIKLSAYYVSTGIFILYYQQIGFFSLRFKLLKTANDNIVKSAQPEAFQSARYNTSRWFKEKDKGSGTCCNNDIWVLQKCQQWCPLLTLWNKSLGLGKAKCHPLPRMFYVNTHFCLCSGWLQNK